MVINNYWQHNASSDEGPARRSSGRSAAWARGALKTSRWVERPHATLEVTVGSESSGEQAGMSKLAHLRVLVPAGMNSCLAGPAPRSGRFLSSEQHSRQVLETGGFRRHLACGGAGIPMWDCSVEREVGTTVLMCQPGPAAHRAFQSESHSSALQGQAQITVSASKWGKGGGLAARATVAVEALLAMWVLGKHPGPGARGGQSSVARCSVLSVHLGVGGPM